MSMVILNHWQMWMGTVAFVGLPYPPSTDRHSYIILNQIYAKHVFDCRYILSFLVCPFFGYYLVIVSFIHNWLVHMVSCCCRSDIIYYILLSMCVYFLYVFQSNITISHIVAYIFKD